MTGLTFGFACHADVASVQNHPVVRVKLKISGNVVFDRAFDRVHVFARRDAAAVAKAEDMCVHGLRGLGPPHVQHDIRRLAPHTRKALQGGAAVGDDTVIFIHQDLAEFDDVLGLVAIQPDGFDMFDHALKPEVEHFLRRVGDLEQLCGGFVHTLVGRLCGQGDGDDQRVDVHVIKFAHRFGFACVKACKNLSDRVIIELFGQFCHLDLVATVAAHGKPIAALINWKPYLVMRGQSLGSAVPTYTFYIYSVDVLSFNSGTGAFDFDAGYIPSQDRYRIEVDDDDDVMNASGDANQNATIYDSDNNVVNSGNIFVPAYASVDDGSGGTIFLDRVEVNGVHYGYVSSQPLTPGASYPVTSTDTFEENHTYYQANSVPCFGPDAVIDTVNGPCPVTKLRVGDRVMTYDNGAQPVLWTGSRSISRLQALASPQNRPVVFAGGDARNLWSDARPYVVAAAPCFDP